jgi:hypothetical protein
MLRVQAPVASETLRLLKQRATINEDSNDTLEALETSQLSARRMEEGLFWFAVLHR